MIPRLVLEVGDRVVATRDIQGKFCDPDGLVELVGGVREGTAGIIRSVLVTDIPGRLEVGYVVDWPTANGWTPRRDHVPSDLGLLLEEG